MAVPLRRLASVRIEAEDGRGLQLRVAETPWQYLPVNLATEPRCLRTITLLWEVKKMWNVQNRSSDFELARLVVED